MEENEHLAFAEERHDPQALLARLLSGVISIVTEALIFIATRGDSMRLNAALRAEKAARS